MKELLQKLTIEAAKARLIAIVEDEYQNPSDDYDQLTENDKDTLIGWVNDATITLALQTTKPFLLDDNGKTIAEKIETVITTQKTAYEAVIAKHNKAQKSMSIMTRLGGFTERAALELKLRDMALPSPPIDINNCYPLLEKLAKDYGFFHSVLSDVEEAINKHEALDAIKEFLGDSGEAYNLLDSTTPSL